jgi:two-component system, OmpR family, KDP operon response regulator KdpE
MFTIKILLIANNLDAGELLTYALERRGLAVTLQDKVQQAIKQWRTNVYALAIVNECDNLLDGIAVCEILRQEATLPILLLTYEQNEEYSLKAYQAGVNECIVKPVGTRLLMAKVMTWLRCTGILPTDSLADVAVGDLQLQVDQRRLMMANGRIVNLTNLELRLLHCLLSHPRQTLEPTVIVEYVWGYRGEDDTPLLKHVVYRLRRKIEPDPSHPRYIRTVAGGYVLLPE